MCWPLALTLITALLTGPPAVRADGPAALSPDTTAPAVSPVRAHVGVWYARSLAGGSVLGSIPAATLQLVGIRYRRRLLPRAEQPRDGAGTPTLTYTADLLPFAALHIPGSAIPAPYYADASAPGPALRTSGAGGYPVGLRVEWRWAPWLRPFLDGQTGMLYFRDRIPDGRGRRLHFAAALGGGLHLRLASTLLLTVGYRYHHLSNGFRGSINPGLDANLLYVGLGTPL